MMNSSSSRGYKAGMVKDAVEKAREIPRQEALKKVEKDHQPRSVFVVQ